MEKTLLLITRYCTTQLFTVSWLTSICCKLVHSIRRSHSLISFNQVFLGHPFCLVQSTSIIHIQRLTQITTLLLSTRLNHLNLLSAITKMTGYNPTKSRSSVLSSFPSVITRAAVGMEISIDMSMGTAVMNPHGPVGMLWGFLNGCEIKQKRDKCVINVIVDVWILVNRVKFEFVLMTFLNFSCMHYHYWITIYHYVSMLILMTLFYT